MISTRLEKNVVFGLDFGIYVGDNSLNLVRIWLRMLSYAVQIVISIRSVDYGLRPNLEYLTSKFQIVKIWSKLCNVLIYLQVNREIIGEICFAKSEKIVVVYFV